MIDFFPLWLSLRTAGISTIVVFIFGIIFAYIISRKRFYFKNVIEAVFLLPLVLPPTVVGFVLLYLFGKNGIIGKLLIDLFDFQIVFTWYGALIASIVVSFLLMYYSAAVLFILCVVSFPLMYQSAAAAFSQYDPSLENAALTLGKSKWKVFWTISFPLAWPGLLAGLVLAFARGLGEFGATLMLAGYIPNATDTIPL